LVKQVSVKRAIVRRRQRLWLDPVIRQREEKEAYQA